MDQVEEYWEDIKGFEGRYQISTWCRVRCLVDSHLRAKVPTIKKQYVGKDGYWKVSLYNHRKMKLCKPHRLAAIAFIPNPLNLPFVNHLDGNKLNNNLSNFEWCTPKGNSEHASKTGLYKGMKGEDSPMSIWTDEEVIAIKTDINNGLTSRELYNKYTKLDCKNLYLFRKNKTWLHLPIRVTFGTPPRTPRRGKYKAINK